VNPVPEQDLPPVTVGGVTLGSRTQVLLVREAVKLWKPQIASVYRSMMRSSRDYACRLESSNGKAAPVEPGITVNARFFVLTDTMRTAIRSVFEESVGERSRMSVGRAREFLDAPILAKSEIEVAAAIRRLAGQLGDVEAGFSKPAEELAASLERSDMQRIELRTDEASKEVRVEISLTHSGVESLAAEARSHLSIGAHGSEVALIADLPRIAHGTEVKLIANLSTGETCLTFEATAGEAVTTMSGVGKGPGGLAEESAGQERASDEVSLVLFRVGADQPASPEAYCRDILHQKYKGTDPRLGQWRIVGTRSALGTGKAVVFYHELIIRGEVPDLGPTSEEATLHTTGPDGREVVALFFLR
jgi:hypothetical protein